MIVEQKPKLYQYVVNVMVAPGATEAESRRISRRASWRLLMWSGFLLWHSMTRVGKVAHDFTTLEEPPHQGTFVGVYIEETVRSEQLVGLLSIEGDPDATKVESVFYPILRWPRLHLFGRSR